MSEDERRPGDDVDAIHALLASLQGAENLNPRHVHYVIAELVAFLPDAATGDRSRGTAFNGRLIAIEEDASPDLSSPDAL